MRRASDRE
jgi:hypothetical protein